MTIARREVFARIRQATRERQEVDAQSVDLPSAVSESPEQITLRAEREAIARKVLTALAPRQREVLTRFYLDGQTEEEIRAATGLSANQFRLIKWRAKQRYADLVKELLNKGRQPNGSPTAKAAEIQPTFSTLDSHPLSAAASRASAPSVTSLPSAARVNDLPTKVTERFCRLLNQPDRRSEIHDAPSPHPFTELNYTPSLRKGASGAGSGRYDPNSTHEFF
jgi:hypothetical protein